MSCLTGILLCRNELYQVCGVRSTRKSTGSRGNSGWDKKKGAQDETFNDSEPCSKAGSTREMRSPARVCEAARAPERISTTAKPRQDPTIRRPGTFSAARTTRPSREAMRMSIGNRMKNVWTMLLGAMMRAWPGGSPSRPSRPRLREAESKAGSSFSATTRPVRSFRRTSGGASRRVRARRKCDLRAYRTRFQGLSERMMAMRIRYRTGCPSRSAGLNFHALAAAMSMRSWKRRMGDTSWTRSTSPVSLTMTSK